jgi:hypothetical protein
VEGVLARWTPYELQDEVDAETEILNEITGDVELSNQSSNDPTAG